MKKIKGFTLTELMATIAIIMILMSVAVPTFIGARRRANANACRANLEIINSAQKEWALDHPDTAVAGYTPTTANVGPYIEGGWASMQCPDEGAYSLQVIDANGALQNPLCSYAATDPDHAIQ